MNKRKTLILIVGETGAGKDTVANKLPWPKICSYSTRKMRNSDVQGKNHLFISDEEMDELEKNKHILAWTKTGNIRYCATFDQLKEDITIYIINPDGVRWFKNTYDGPELNVIIFGLYLPLDERKERCKTRSDFKTAFSQRVKDEQKDYDNFRLNGDFDYLIRNDDSSKTAEIIYDIVRKELIFHEREKI